MILLYVLAGLLAAAFVFSGGRKLTGSSGVREEAAHLNIPVRVYRLIGLAEVAGSVGLLVGLLWLPLAIAAGAALAVLMVGAVGSHLRVRDRYARAVPATALGILAVTTAITGLVLG